VLNTTKVEIDNSGRVRPLEPGKRLRQGQALITFLEPHVDETLLLTEAALAGDWLKPEEDAAWPHLKPDAS